VYVPFYFHMFGAAALLL